MMTNLQLKYVFIDVPTFTELWATIYKERWLHLRETYQ